MSILLKLIALLKELRHYLDDLFVLLFFVVGIFVALRHGLEFAADYIDRLRDKEHRYRVRTTIVKDMMEERFTRTAKLRRLRVSKTLKELILDPWPNIIPLNDDERPAKLTHFYSVPGRLGTREDQEKKEFRLLLGRDEELRKHREYSTLLVYTLGEPITEILTPPSFEAVQPVGKECFTYEVHFPANRKFVRNRDLEDPHSKDEPRIKIYKGAQVKDHELIYEPIGWKGRGGFVSRVWTWARNKFRTRYHVIGGRTDFGDGHGKHDWFRVTILKPPQKENIHICWCMQEDPISKWKWCKHTADDHSREMTDLINSARKTFRQLAVFEVDAKKSAAASANWEKNRYLLAAADVVDDLFWRQSSPDRDYRSFLEELPDNAELREMFLFNRGPYDRFNNNKPFLQVEPEFSGKGFYPTDLTPEEFTDHIRRHREEEAAFESPYTIIKRANSHLIAVPYHEAYQDLVKKLSGQLNHASTLERHAGFKEYLIQRAKDLLTDDYHSSETLWVKLEDNPIDLVIGPYEVYEDGLMGLKAAYEAIIFERDFEESAKLQNIQHNLPGLSQQVEAEMGKPLQVQNNRLKLSVANLVYAAGEGRKAVPAIAFCLPNDERVVEEVGSRQVILKNVIEAKFNLVAEATMNRVLEKTFDDRAIAFQHFFIHTLFHEISHSLGPQRITVNGESTTVNRCLRQYHSVLEEAKADTLGACLALHSDAKLDAGLFLRGHIGRLVRSIRFGLDQAHGGANAIQFNYLLQEGAFTVNPETGKLSVNETIVRKAVFKLAANIIDIQARGDFSAARNLSARFCVGGPSVEAAVSLVKDLPIDIRIRYANWIS